MLHVELVSPERILYEGEADQVICRTTEGEIAFLTGHAPFLGALAVAPVRISSPTTSLVAAVHGGFVEVRDDRVIILSDVAELPDQIDAERARLAQQRAEERLRADEGDEDARAALARATVRLELTVAAV
jgi:F-type H+-transporting ATPase subunit epsilon